MAATPGTREIRQAPAVDPRIAERVQAEIGRLRASGRTEEANQLASQYQLNPLGTYRGLLGGTNASGAVAKRAAFFGGVTDSPALRKLYEKVGGYPADALRAMHQNGGDEYASLSTLAGNALEESIRNSR
ncbi:MAG: hypothetical protein HYT77_01925 [Deltaproteobacteria bacterium]|nr:hypothetical protein [Deltaproteobacteria bacterium]